MTRVLALAVVVAAANTAAGAWLGRKAREREGRFWWLEGAALFLRVCVIFGTAHWVWRRGRRAGEVVAFLVTAAVLQLVAQVWLHIRRERAEGRQA